MLRHLLFFLLIISFFKNGCLLDTRRTDIEFVFGTGKCCKHSMELVNNDVKSALDITTAGRWFSGVNGKHRERRNRFYRNAQVWHVMTIQACVQSHSYILWLPRENGLSKLWSKASSSWVIFEDNWFDFVIDKIYICS